MSRKGFTLIELLIVIAILGILVALILPRFSDVRKDANTKVCIANLRGLVSAMNTYDVQYNVTSDWGADTLPDRIDVQDMVDLKLLSTVVTCPVAGGNYTIDVDATNDPIANCSYGPAPGDGSLPDHKWPQ